MLVCCGLGGTRDQARELLGVALAGDVCYLLYPHDLTANAGVGEVGLDQSDQLFGVDRSTRHHVDVSPGWCLTDLVLEHVAFGKHRRSIAPCRHSTRDAGADSVALAERRALHPHLGGDHHRHLRPTCGTEIQEGENQELRDRVTRVPSPSPLRQILTLDMLDI